MNVNQFGFVMRVTDTTDSILSHQNCLGQPVPIHSFIQTDDLLKNHALGAFNCATDTNRHISQSFTTQTDTMNKKTLLGILASDKSQLQT